MSMFSTDWSVTTYEDEWNSGGGTQNGNIFNNNIIFDRLTNLVWA